MNQYLKTRQHGDHYRNATIGDETDDDLSSCRSDIARAKNEWERTVDALPELVCLVDQNGHIVRANRMVERWGLGEVNDVPGMHVHDLLHKDCTSAGCPLRDAVSLSLAEQSSNRYLESAITDPFLGRTLIVHTRLMPGYTFIDNQLAQPCAVVIISDVTALQKAQQELAALNKNLEKRVTIRTAELLQSNKELSAEISRRTSAEKNLKTSRDELSSLTEQLISAQEDERRRLSRELHDSLGQSLGAIKYSLERVSLMQENAAHGDPKAEIASTIEHVSNLIREARSMAMGLRPPMLDDMGVVSAIKWLCDTFSSSFSDTEYRIELAVSNEQIPTQIATPIYRIVQEAMNNVVKHASAKSVFVSLKIEDDAVHLEIFDDGVGFDNSPNDTGQFRQLGKIGRLGMRERAINSNGFLSVRSEPGKGTHVCAVWPLADVKDLVE